MGLNLKSPRHIISIIIIFCIFGSSLSCDLQAGTWDDFKEKFLLFRLSGRGNFIPYERNVDSKDPSFPIEVFNDGYKMVRVYQDLPGVYMVEWSWKLLLRNRSAGSLKFVLSYKLQDNDSFLVVSSQAPAKEIAAGESATLEITDQLPYEKAKRVTNSTWFVTLSPIVPDPR